MFRFAIRSWIGAALMLGAAACDGSESEPSAAAEMADSVAPIDSAMLAVLPAGTSAELLGQGRDLFVPCTVCHGLDGHGTPLGPSLRDTTWVRIRPEMEAIAEIVRTGVPSPGEFPVPMPTMGGGDFDANELRALSTYVYALARSPS